ncbi:MAG: metal-dependent transcriptional regulator [Flavobacteriales bacterium]|nr:metal-dependent transcriptional regulator [Flavobacteriales bacterium]
MNSLIEENYLKALFNLADANGEVSVNELSLHLGIKMPTVTSMMKKLAAKKLVHYQSYKPLRLTTGGKKAAALIIRKHRLTEMYLVEKMGFGWEEVHDIAEQIEHLQSAAFFDRMDKLLGHPTTDPHGSPIPDRNGHLSHQKHIKLADCKPGMTVTLRGVLEESPDFLKYLNSRNIKLGLKLRIKSVEPFDGSMLVVYPGHSGETLSEMVCSRLLVSSS